MVEIGRKRTKALDKMWLGLPTEQEGLCVRTKQAGCTHTKEGTRGLIDRLTSGKTVECPEDRDDALAFCMKARFVLEGGVGEPHG